MCASVSEVFTASSRPRPFVPRQPRARPRRGWALAGLSLVLILAGCGDGSDDTRPVIPQPQPPVSGPLQAVERQLVTTEDTAVDVVLAVTGATPAAGEPAFEILAPPAFGALAPAGDGFVYEPDPDFFGTDRFRYGASVSGVAARPATVTIEVTPINDPPVVDDVVLFTDQGMPVDGMFNVRDPDGDTNFSFRILEPPVHGDVAIGAGGTFTFTPDPAFSGEANFVYDANDGQANAATPAEVVVNVIDRTAPALTDSELAGGAPLATDPNDVALTIDSDDSAVEMRIDGDVLTPPAWIPFAPNTTVTLTPGDGKKTVRVRVRDALENTSAPITTTILLDTGGPQADIAGPAFSNTVTIDIDLTLEDVSGVTAAVLSGDLLTSPELIAPVASTSVELTPAEGTKTVEVRGIDGIDQLGPPATLEVILDQTPPSGAVTATTDATNQPLIGLNLNAQDALSPVTGARIGGDVVGGGWIAFTNFTLITLSGGDGEKTISVRFADEPGNVSQPFTTAVTLDTTGPQTEITTPADGVARQSFFAIAGTAADPGATASGVTEVEVSIQREAGLVDEHFTGEDFSSPFQTFLAADGTNDWSFDALLGVTAEEGDYTVTVRALDRAGNTGANATLMFFIDQTPPDCVTCMTVDAPNAPWVNQTAIDVTATDVTDANPPLEARYAGDITDSFAGTWIAFETPRRLHLSNGDGDKVISVEYRDAAGNVTGAFDAAVTLDTASPAPVAVTLAGGATAVSAATTVAELFAPNAVSANLDGDVAAQTNLAPVTSAEVDLTGPDGIKTVTMTAFDAAGNAAAATDTIRLDRTAPTGALTAPTWTTDDTVSLQLTASDPVTPIEMRLGGDITDTVAGAWIAFAPVTTVHVAAPDGDKTISVRYRDALGNTTALLSQTVTRDTQPPPAPNAVTLAEGAASATAQTTLTIDVGPETASVRITGDTLAPVGWFAFNTGNTAPVAVELAAPDGLEAAWVQTRDAAGNASTTAVSDTIILDTRAPRLWIASGPAALTTSTSAAFSFLIDDPGGTGSTAYCALDGATAAVCPAQFSGLSINMHQVAVTAADEAGNVSAPPALWDWQVAETASCPVETLFADDFESGLANWFNDGATWGTEADPQGLRGDVASDSPGGNYAAGETATISTTINLAPSCWIPQRSRMALRWEHRVELADGDSVAVEATTNGTWRTVRSYQGPLTFATWITETAMLPEAVSGATLTLRLRRTSDNNGQVADGWLVEGVNLRAVRHLPLAFSYQATQPISPVRVAELNQDPNGEELFFAGGSAGYSVGTSDGALQDPPADLQLEVTRTLLAFGDTIDDGVPEFHFVGPEAVGVFDPIANQVFLRAAANLSGSAGAAIGDLDGMGDLDVVAAGTTAGTELPLLDWTSGGFEDVAGGTLPVASNGNIPPVALADVDSDGHAEILVASGFASPASAFVWDPQSSATVWSFAMAATDALAAPLFADLDGGGMAAVFAGGVTITAVTAATGQLRWQAEVPSGPITGLAVGDINGDGRQSVAFVTAQGEVGLLDGDTGRARLRVTTTTTGPFEPALGDIDGDGRVDLVVTSRDGALLLIRDDGLITGTFSAPHPYQGTATLADGNLDGNINVYAGTATGRAYVINGLGATPAANRLPWPTPRHDQKNSGQGTGQAGPPW